MKITRRIAGLAAATALAATLAACTGGSEAAAPEPGDDTVTEQGAPDADTGDEGGTDRALDPRHVDPSVEGWSAVIQQVYAEAGSDAIRDVLADGVLTSDEWADSVARANACLAEAGIEPFENERGLQGQWLAEADEFGRHGGIQLEDATDEEWEALLGCRDRYLGALPAVYEAVSRNPEALTHEALVLQCLYRNDLLPEGFTEQDLFALTETAFGHPATCAEAQADGAWVDVVCTDDGGFTASRNPDWEPPALTLPNGVSLDEGQGAECLWNPAA